VDPDLTSRLKRFALEELGFDLVGVTSGAPPASAGRLRTWIAAGCHGEMTYMADSAETRADPGRFLAGCRSIVCVALSYHGAPEPAESDPAGDRVLVARYARHKDYHKVIKGRLVRLGRLLAEASPGARWRVATDAEPVLERELAQRAGLGWIGKNTCLINRRLGSELLLGELLTDVELGADEPERDHCGTCSACLAACPTKAIVAPRRLDARRCIAYTTIERRSALPVDVGRSVGAHLFGCDLCQAVCPWNRRAAPGTGAPLPPRSRLDGLRLGDLSGLDEAGWHELAAGTPLRRLSFARFRRNLDAVTSNLRNAEQQGAA
jgi:epoxyqueuosine reductase